MTEFVSRKMRSIGQAVPRHTYVSQRQSKVPNSVETNFVATCKNELASSSRSHNAIAF
jgi:hypothetical protein